MVKSYETKLEEDMHSDLKTILSSEKVNIHLLKMCLDMDWITTEEIIAENETIKLKVEQLFTEPDGYWVADEICKEGYLKNIIDVDKKFEEMLENLEKLPGKEIVRIFRTALADTKDAKQTEFLKSVIQCYKEQTSKLHEYEGGDLMYTEFGDSKDCNYWDGYRKDLLDIVGMYQDNPSVEKLAEDKVAKIFSYYMYPQKFPGGEYKQKAVSYVSMKGAEEYADRMVKNIKKDVNSVESKFYIKHAAEVFSRAGDYDMAAGVVLQLIPKLMPKHSEIVGKLIDGLEKCYLDELEKENFRKLKDLAETEIMKSPFSEASQIYIERADVIFKYNYTSFVIRVIEKYKDQYPEFCDKLCHDLSQRFKQQGKNNTKYNADNLTDVYIAYPNEELAEAISGYIDKKTDSYPDYGDFVRYAKYAEKTGLKCYEDLLDRLAFNKKYAFILEGLSNTYKHNILFEHLKKQNLTKLCIQKSENYRLDCSKLLPLTSLTYLNIKGNIKLENPEKLLELPNLESLYISLNQDQSDQLYKILLKNKPKNLHDLGEEIAFTDYQANQLMEKYPDLLVKGGDDSLRNRNESVINAINADEPLLAAIQGNVLAEYLSFISADKNIKMADFMKKIDFNDKEYANYFEFLRHIADDKKYQECVALAANLSNDQKFKDEVNLWIAVENKNIVEYLKALPQDRKPTIEQMSETLFSYGKAENIWQIIEDKYKVNNDKTPKVIKDILTTLEFKKQDTEKLPENKSLTEAVTQWRAQQKISQGNAAAQAAFKAWQESKGIKK